MVTKILIDLPMFINLHCSQPPQEPLIIMKRGADVPRLLMEVVGITLMCRCSNQSTLYARTVITVLAHLWKFPTFPLASRA